LNQERESAKRFEEMALPQLDSAYNLAQYLARDVNDAEDIVQESYFRAFRAFGTFRGGEIRPWLLAIVRNTCNTWLSRNRARPPMSVPDERLDEVQSRAPDPQTALDRADEQQSLTEAIDRLPPEYREVIVLRELEGLSYKQIADFAQIPIGTVMSRLARAREKLERNLLGNSDQPQTRGGPV
jgi:RNA polymerase sigma-70 factor (ECF subfamily)